MFPLHLRKDLFELSPGLVVVFMDPEGLRVAYLRDDVGKLPPTDLLLGLAEVLPQEVFNSFMHQGHILLADKRGGVEIAASLEHNVDVIHVISIEFLLGVFEKLGNEILQDVKLFLHIDVLKLSKRGARFFKLADLLRLAILKLYILQFLDDFLYDFKVVIVSMLLI